MHYLLRAASNIKNQFLPSYFARCKEMLSRIEFGLKCYRILFHFCLSIIADESENDIAFKEHNYNLGLFTRCNYAKYFFSKKLTLIPCNLLTYKVIVRPMVNVSNEIIVSEVSRNKDERDGV